MAAIKRRHDVREQIPVYDRLAALIAFFQNWEVRAFDSVAADQFKALRKQRVRIGTQDLKIASIALANDALLLSANTRDFDRVPGLEVENWLE